MRRHILVISPNEQLGRRFRYLLAGLRIGFPTTVVTDLAMALPVLKRLRPRVVIFVAENGGKADDQLMLLRTLLLLGEHGHDDALALLYDPGRDRLTMYHNIQLSGLRPEEVAQAVVKTVSCPLFGCEEERRADYPKDCRFLPLAVRNAALAVESLAKAILRLPHPEGRGLLRIDAEPHLGPRSSERGMSAVEASKREAS
jgi:hypothetical protein